jgi:glycosyltransferase involved in cell wall biosynthesis
MRRILFVTRSCDIGDGPSSDSGLMLVKDLAPSRFACEVLYGVPLGADRAGGPSDRPSGRWLEFDAIGGTVSAQPGGVRVDVPPHLSGTIDGVPVTIHCGPLATSDQAGDAGLDEFLALLEFILDRFRPDVVVALGGGRLALDVLARGRARGAATVLRVDPVDAPDFRGIGPPVVRAVDAVVMPSEFAAEYCREAFGLPGVVLPPPIDLGRAVVEPTGPGYLTFLEPTPARGVYPFARIAHELGRRRPDIPILVVEGRGTEGDVAACGLDLKGPGNLGVMAPARDRRDYWSLTRVCLMPSLGWADQSREVAEALANGIPVIAADRGGLPEALGESGIVLSLPDRLTPATRLLPTAEEVAPWIEAVIRFWDDEEFARDHRWRASAEARRRSLRDDEDRHRRFFEELRPGRGIAAATPPSRAMSVVLVPHLNGIDWECEQGLRRLEEEGVKVVRRGGSSAIDIARNDLASNALHDGFESLIFIDADVGFDPLDVFRLLARPEPVVCGVYAKKGRRGLASQFAEGLTEVLLGADAPGLYPVRYAATGFLRIKAATLRRMIAELELPLCNTKWGRGVWPFFMPIIVPLDGNRLHYLGEDWAFSHRLGQIGVTPLADTSIRLWHWGRHAYGWEDAGSDRPRYGSYNFRLPDD